MGKARKGSGRRWGRLGDGVGLAVLVVLLGLTVKSNLVTGRLVNAFSYLSYSFMDGRLDLVDYPSKLDVTENEGKVYLPQGPLPGLLMVPMFYWRRHWYDNNPGFLSVCLNLVNLVLVFGIARKVLGEKGKALWMTLAYMFGSAYMGIAMESAVWYQGQLTAATGMLGALYFYLSGKWWGVGMGLAFAISARLNSGLAGLFFIGMVVLGREALNLKLRKLVAVAVPVGVVVLVLGWYNWARFGSVFESGYTKQQIHPPASVEQRDKGWYRLENIPTNVYYYFLRGLDGVVADTHLLGEYRLMFPYFTMQNSGPGWGFFMMSPVFLLIFSRKPKGVEEWVAVGVVGVILGLLLMFFVPGSRQFGPRYANDFLPLLFLILLKERSEKKFGWGLKLLVLGSAVLNMWVFGSYNGLLTGLGSLL